MRVRLLLRKASILRSLLVLFLLLAAPLAASAQSERIGIVIMHGKGGSPTGLVAELARTLEGRGYLVANLEMPWSGDRGYDVPVVRAEEEVTAALARLRDQGAGKLFVAGHSLGGAFATHLAGRLSVDGIIAIAPGGDVSNRVYRISVSDALERARKLVAEGKGGERAELVDYEGSTGAYAVLAVPAAYVTWFDPDGALNMGRATRAANPRTPILWIVPKQDYPGLLKVSLPLYRDLPRHPLTRLYEPNSGHRDAPTASAEEIVRWTEEVASSR
jgi:pimeloyl-ACP methyl ester carboxylesterase